MKQIGTYRVFAALLILTMTLSTPVRAAPSVNQPPQAVPASNAGHAAATLGKTIEIGADSYGLPIAEDETAGLYDKPSVLLQKDDAVAFDVSIENDGLYTVSFDMAAVKSFIHAPEGQLKVDGDFPALDARRIVFPIFYQNSVDKFPLDRYGNEALIRQETLIRWSRVAMRDPNFSLSYPVQLNLTKGQHSFEFTLTKESMLLGSIYVEPFSKYPDYAEYLASHSAPDSSGVQLELEAEFPSYKNDTVVRPINSRSLEVTPYNTNKLLLNNLGGESWQRSGTAVYYEFNVPQDGLYNITLRFIQSFKNNFTTFRRITINDSVVFDQLNEVPFGYSTRWTNLTLGGETPYKFYLKKGINVVGFEATNSPYHSAILKIQKVLVDINNLSLEVKKLTGNQIDPNKEWVISDYIPDIKDQLLAIAADLQADMQGLTAINQAGGSQEILTYQMAIDNINFLAEDPDKLPARMNRFSDGTGSAAALLGKILPLLQNQPLGLDKIYVHSPDVVIQPTNVSAWKSLTEGVMR
ncbi:ABC transporter substrate-binding protein, partial [bacterium]|nr:ABC transporter substrate-binding protein [bacterium]